MLAGLAALSFLALAEGACNAASQAQCTAKHSKPSIPATFPDRSSSRLIEDYCAWTKGLYGCLASAGCPLDGCTTAVSLGKCKDTSVCSASADEVSSDGVRRDYETEDKFDYSKYPPHAPFFGFMGAAAALIFANMGAAYGTAKSGRGISTMGVLYPALVMKHIIPVVMAGVLGIYGLIIAVIIGNGVTGFKNNEPVYSAFKGFAHLGGGLACGLSGLAAGMAIGIVGDYGVRSAAEQPKLYVGMVLVLIFSEALGLYGLIVGLILTSKE